MLAAPVMTYKPWFGRTHPSAMNRLPCASKVPLLRASLMAEPKSLVTSALLTTPLAFKRYSRSSEGAV